MSMTSSSSRRPFGNPATSPPKTPSLEGLADGRDRQVDAEHVRELGPGVVQVGNAREQDGDEIAAARLRRVHDARVELVDRRSEDRLAEVLDVPRVVGRLAAVPLVLERRRDDDLVHERVAEARDLHPRAVAAAPRLELAPLGGGPDADRVVGVVELGDRDLQGDRVDGVVGEEVLPAAHVPRATPERDEVEDRADVAEERVLALAGEHLPAAVEVEDPRVRERAVVGRPVERHVRPRPDVRRGRQATGDNGSAPLPVHAADRVPLDGLREEERARQVPEPEPVRHVRLGVTVPVDLDRVAGLGREPVPHRSGRRILGRDPVRDDREHVRLVGRPPRVEIRVVGRRVLGDGRGLAVARGRCALGRWAA